MPARRRPAPGVHLRSRPHGDGSAGPRPTASAPRRRTDRALRDRASRGGIRRSSPRTISTRASSCLRSPMNPPTCSHGNRWVRMTLTMEMASRVSTRPGFVIRKTNKVAATRMPAPTASAGTSERGGTSTRCPSGSARTAGIPSASLAPRLRAIRHPRCGCGTIRSARCSSPRGYRRDRPQHWPRGRRRSRRAPSAVDVADHEEDRAQDGDQVRDQGARKHRRDHTDVGEGCRPHLQPVGCFLPSPTT